MRYLLCLVFITATAYAAPPMPSADPPTPQPAPVAPVVIHVPPDNPAPPTPPPGPRQPTKLGKGVLFEITSSTPLFIVASPDGLVKISAPKTPVTIFGTFIDPLPGDDDGRTFADGFVYLVQAAGVGKVELIMSAGVGTTTLRRCLLVDDGSVPVPPTPPNPPGPTDPLVAAFQAAYAADADANKVANLKWLASVYFNASALLAPTTPPAPPPPATYAALLTEVSGMYHVPSGFPKGGMPHLVIAIGKELDATLGTAVTPVDVAKTTTEFQKISAALLEVK